MPDKETPAKQPTDDEVISAEALEAYVPEGSKDEN